MHGFKLLACVDSHFFCTKGAWRYIRRKKTDQRSAHLVGLVCPHRQWTLVQTQSLRPRAVVTTAGGLVALVATVLLMTLSSHIRAWVWEAVFNPEQEAMYERVVKE